MFRVHVRCILIALLVLGTMPLQAAGQTVAQQVAKLSMGREIKVELTNGETVKGRMGSATATQFSLESRNAGQGAARAIRFEEARSVKADGLTAKRKWGIFAGIWLALGVVSLAIGG